METLGDDLVLLSLNPVSGRVRTAQKIAYGLMGSELVRLVGAQRVDIADDRLLLRSAAPTGDAELDAALASLAQARRPPRAGHWVSHPRRGITAAYLDRLAAAGIIRKESALLTRWRVADAVRLADARARIDAIATSTSRLDLAQAAFGGLAHAIGLDAALYPGWGNRAIRRRFKEVADGAWTNAIDPRLAAGLDAGADAGADTEAPAAHHAAVHHASHAAVSAATDAAVHAATEAAVHAATEAAVHAATQAAVHAAVHATVDASASAAHSAGAAGGHAGH